MDRFTRSKDGKFALIDWEGKVRLDEEQAEILTNALARLAAYEDTGLTPDEIAAIRVAATLLESDRDAERKIRLAAEEEIERLCAALKLAQARARDYDTDIEAGRLVRLPGELIAPYELNARYWICGWDSERCTLTIQDRVLMAEEAAHGKT